MLTIMEHELDAAGRSFSSYLCAAVLLVVTGISSLFYNINSAVANFEYVLASASIIYVLVIPVLTMKSIAEERKQKTDQLLYSLPLSMDEIVLGKYLSMVVLLFIPMIFIAIYPYLFSNFGNVYLPTSYGTLFAFFLLGAALISVGMFVSSLTENQGLAAGITAVIIALNYYLVDLSEYATSTAIGSLIAITVFVILIFVVIKTMTQSAVLAGIVSGVLEVATLIVFIINDDLFVGLVPSIMKKISLFERFYAFVNGVFDITAVVYFLSVAAFFVFLTVQSMEKRRYN